MNVVLYADDDADDRLLLSDAFERLTNEYVIELLHDGIAVIDYLNEKTPPMPCLLILDLNMPGLSGTEVMERLKGHEHYRNLNIVVFTTSSSPSDREACTALGVDMITKPSDLKEFEATAKRLLTYC
ncbi:MAG: response regulator [Chitinophagaceae bacterium]|nr:MAG: response regulator [Chitinophagaceae bacterium]